MGIRPEHILAIGDANNDLPLFTHARIKVAVGDASPKLKNAATEIVAPQIEDGFAEAINRFVLKGAD